MKKTFLLSAIAMIMLGLFSCKDEQPKTLKDILIGNKWTYSYYLVENGYHTFNYLDSVPYKERYMKFTERNILPFSTFLYGDVPYDSTAWSLNEKQDTLTLDLIMNNHGNSYRVISVQQILTFTDNSFETKEIKDDGIHWRNYRALSQKEIEIIAWTQWSF